MPADVAESGRSQQGVAQGVEGDVTVRVRHQPPDVRNAHAPEHHVIAVSEGVNVEPLTDTEIHGQSLTANCCRMNSAKARSSGPVILMLLELPLTSSGR